MQRHLNAFWLLRVALGVIAVLSLTIQFSYAQVTLNAPNSTTLSLIIVKSCLLNGSAGPSGVNLGTLNFGQHLSLPTPITAQTSGGTNGIRVKCTPGTTAVIKINTGVNALGGVRRMKHSTSANFITYQVYKDAARTQVWDASVGLSHAFATDTEQSFPLYGRVPNQVVGAAGIYNDTLTVTLEF